MKNSTRKRKSSRRKPAYYKKARRQVSKKIVLLVLILVVLIIIIAGVTKHHRRNTQTIPASIPVDMELEDRPPLDVELLSINEYSRPGIALDEVKGIVIHYTANPGASAIANRNYFEGLATSGATHASSHFIIGLEGEIVQCIPCQEISYASNDRNDDTISIECCIEDETGAFNEQTYASMVELTAWLVGRYNLSADDIIRHYDITGKICPKYFVDHEDAWEQFKTDVVTYLTENGTQK